VAYEFEKELMIRREHVLLAQRFAERRARFSRQYVDVQGKKAMDPWVKRELTDCPTQANPVLSNSAEGEVVWWRYTTPQPVDHRGGSLFVGSIFCLAPPPDRAKLASAETDSQGSERAVPAYVRFLRTIRPVMDEVAGETAAMSEDRAWTTFTPARRAAGTATLTSSVAGVEIQSSWLTWEVPIGSQNLPDTLLWWVGAMFGMGVLYAGTRAASKSLDWGHLCSGSPLQHAFDFGAIDRVLIVGPPLSGKTDHIRSIPGVRLFDLRRFSRRKRRQAEWVGAVAAEAALARGSSLGNGPQLGNGPLMGNGPHPGQDPSPARDPDPSYRDVAAGSGDQSLDMPDWRKDLPDDPNAPVALDHFEHRIEEPMWLGQKLDILEQLVFRYQRKVLVVSSVDPLEVFNGSHHRDDVELSLRDRWTRLFGTFERRELVGQQPAAAVGALTLQRKLSHLPRARISALVACFERECSATRHLSAIGADLVKDLPDSADLNPETLLEEVQTRAEPYYRSLWASCTKEEKLALVQLADEGVLNPESRSTGRRLVEKHLVVCDPFPRIANESFRRFARGALSSATVTRWEQGQKLPLHTLLLASVFGFTLFLFFTQQQIAQAWVGYLAAAAAAVPALFNALGTVRSGLNGSKT
jgi:hypothetical protein